MVSNRTQGFLIGLVAGVLATILSYFLRIFAGGVFVPELASQTLFSLIPGEIEAKAVESLGSLAKYSTFAGASLLNILFYGVVGAVLYRLYERLPGRGYPAKALQCSLIAYCVVLAGAALLLIKTEVLTQPTSIPHLALYLLPPHIAFGLALSSLYKREMPRPRLICEEVPSLKKIDHKRRLIIRAGAGAAVASAILYYGLDLLFRKPAVTPPEPILVEPTKPPAEPRGIFSDPSLGPLVASEVTPNDQFYIVDINAITPKVDVKAWKLIVKGLVSSPLALTYDELRSLPAVEHYNTLECVSNKVGGDLISNALWKGVRLKDLLEKAHVKQEAGYIIFRCFDGYDVGIPLERGLLDGTILAYDMNAVPLPTEHGYPLRALVPGLYGMMNAKWITEIELANRVHVGFWQRRGWSNTAEYQTHSMIVLPGDNPLRKRLRSLGLSRVALGGKAPIAGVAFAGDRGISKVEISTDGGQTWETASIKDPLSEYTWVLWAAEWNPPAKGEYKITVRATDKNGKVQTAELRDPFPSGATGYHVIDIRVEAAN